MISCLTLCPYFLVLKRIMSASANVGFHPAQILPENEGQQQHYVGKTAEEMDEERKQQMAYQVQLLIYFFVLSILS